MHRIAAAAIAAALLPSVTLAAGKHGSGKKYHQTPPRVIIKRMVQALSHQPKMQAYGMVFSGKRRMNHYLLRYQAGGREALAVRSFGKGVVTGRTTHSQVVHYIFIGRDEYTSLNGSRWYRATTGAHPLPTDILALNAQGATCCSSGGPRLGETFWNMGLHVSRGRKVYTIAFRGATPSGAGASGSVQIDAHSYLPLSETVTSIPGKLTGRFTIKYGGTFSIGAPRV